MHGTEQGVEHRCTHCGRDVRSDLEAEKDYCSACGHPIERPDEEPPPNCTHCGRDVRSDLETEKDYCSACGHPIERPDEEPPPISVRKLGPIRTQT